MVTTNDTERATLTVKETAKLLGLSENSTYEYLIQGLIPAKRLSKRWIISRSAILKWLDEK